MSFKDYSLLYHKFIKASGRDTLCQPTEILNFFTTSEQLHKILAAMSHKQVPHILKQVLLISRYSPYALLRKTAIGKDFWAAAFVKVKIHKRIVLCCQWEFSIELRETPFRKKTDERFLGFFKW